MTPDQNLEELLKRRTRFARLVHAASCGSTQALANDEDTHSSQGFCDTVYWADHQTDGRGRQDREWHDEPGLDLSVTFRVTARLPRPVALAAALPVAVLQACEPRVGRPLRIKWPNDVFVDDRKLSGVLIDVDSRRPDTMRIGVGVNVNRTSFPDSLRDTATSLLLESGAPHDRAALLLDLAAQVDAVITAVETERLRPLEARFAERLGLLGERVEVVAGDRMTGTLLAIDFDRLRFEDGREVPLAIVRSMLPLDA